MTSSRVAAEFACARPTYRQKKDAAESFRSASESTTWRVRSDACVDAGAVEPFCNLRTDFTETVNDSAADAAPAPVMTATFRSKSLLTRYAVSAG